VEHNNAEPFNIHFVFMKFFRVRKTYKYVDLPV
jgi:hypothetical protein